MARKINGKEYHQNNPASRAFIRLMTDHYEFMLPPKEDYEVHVQIDGIEMDFHCLMDLYANSFDELVYEKAKSIIRDEIQAKLDSFEASAVQAIDAIDNLSKEFFNSLAGSPTVY